MIFIKSRNCKIPELKQNPRENYTKYANLRKIPWKLRKICELRQNPVRITQNMRTYAKSRENYAKYANLRKIPWELRKICELTQNPVRITNLTWALYTTISLYITTTEGRSNELSSLYSSSFREFFAKNHRQYCIDFFNSSPIFRRFPRS